MESVKQVLRRRDCLSSEEAQERWDEAKDEIDDIISSGGTLEEVEEVLKDHFGLEPDYIHEFL